MATSRELQSDLDAVVRPRELAVSEALRIPDRNRALLAVHQNLRRDSDRGSTVAWAYEAMLKVNSSRVPSMFFEWSPAEVGRARKALSEVGAPETVAAIDEVFEYVGVDPELDELPDSAVDVLQSDAFEQWKRESLPTPLLLADKLFEQILEYVQRHVHEL